MRRLWIGLSVGGLVLVVATKIVEWACQAQWFAALGYGDTFARLMTWRAGAFLVGAGLWLAILLPNARLALTHIARRREALELLGPSGRLEPPPPSLLLPPDPPVRLRRIITGSLVALGVWGGGMAAANRFDVWMAFFGAAGLGEIDPASGRDLSFFLFILPALEWAWNSFGLALAWTLLGVAALYVSAELIETGPRLLRVAHRAAWHLTTLGALLVLWLGVRHGLNIVGAPVSAGWTPTGIFGAPEARFGVPAHALALASSLGIAPLGLVWAARGQAGRAWVWFSVWAFMATVAPSIAPSFGRALQLNDSDAQQRALARHIRATRRAWGLDAVQTRRARISGEATTLAPTRAVASETGASETGASETGVAAAPDAAFESRRAQLQERFGGAPLWPAGVAASVLETRDTDSERAVGRAYFDVSDGRLVVRALSSKRGAPDDAPAVMLESDVETPGALPETRRVPIQSVLLGEADFDARRGDSLRASVPPLPAWRQTQESSGAIARDTFLPSLALAWRFFDASLLRPGPPVTWHLDPIERAQTLMPFVDWNGAIARPVVVEGALGERVFYFVDGCFSSRFFPDAAALPASLAPSLGGWRGVNYARQSVLAVLDATTGEATFYLLSPDEPLSRLWKRAFPGAWQDGATMPSAFRAAIRTSMPLADASAQIWSRYHTATPRTDETAAWATGESNWRALADDFARSPWNRVRRPGDDAPTLTCSFATSTGRARQTSNAASIGALVATLQASERLELGQQHPRWQELRLEPELDLPALVNSAPARLLPNRSPLPNPVTITILPRIGGADDSQGDAQGDAELLIVRGEIAAPQTPDTPALAEVRYALFGALPAAPGGDETESLEQVRTLWTQLRTARSAGRWGEVARLEASLNEVLRVPKAEKSGPPASIER